MDEAGTISVGVRKMFTGPSLLGHLLCGQNPEQFLWNAREGVESSVSPEPSLMGKESDLGRSLWVYRSSLKGQSLIPGHF